MTGILVGLQEQIFIRLVLFDSNPSDPSSNGNLFGRYKTMLMVGNVIIEWRESGLVILQKGIQPDQIQNCSIVIDVLPHLKINGAESTKLTRVSSFLPIIIPYFLLSFVN